MIELSQMERDAITEILNLGMGAAAGTLSEVLGEEVIVNIPSIEFTSKKDMPGKLGGSSNRQLAAISETFEGPFYGESLLIFSEESGVELVSCLLKTPLAIKRLSELEEEALLEVGNMVLNACLGGIANVLLTEISATIPRVIKGTCGDIFQDLRAAIVPEDLVMLLNVSFELQTKKITGYVTFILGITAVEDFRKLVNLRVAELC
ncbi:MAG: hypothetical protein HQM09_21350 [Candidatus Riflebacteria bacterium]|nr:hypothetical protein [Candidatus Riflebacteria bacterium]